MVTAVRRGFTLLVAAGTWCADARLSAQGADVSSVRGDSVIVRFADTELRAALQSLGAYLDRPLAIGSGVGAGRVSFETPRAVPRADLPRLLRGVLESQGLELLTDTAAGIYRVQPRATIAPRTIPASPPRVAGGSLELFSIRLTHVRAQDVAATVNALYGRASAIGELGARPRPLADELRDNTVAPTGAPPQLAAAPPPMRTAGFVGEVTIVPDARSNSLLVRASREDFQLVEAAVREIDVRPLQVLIEVLVVEVRRSSATSLGLDLQLRSTKVGNVGTVSGGQSGLGLGDLVLSVMDVGGRNIDATLRAAGAVGDARVVSRPVVIAANNEDASILVGSQRPFVQVQRSLPTESPTRDQVVQYKDVGTRLVVRPTISDDRYVMLDVMQEVNQATAESAFDAPVISTRTLKTRLLIKDGQMVVLGGLTDRQRDHAQSGVPFLSRIPWLGGLFGRVTDQVTETELFIFIRPQVLKTDNDAGSVTDPKLKRTGEEPR
ncbi:MAG: type II secretion system protein GspD [Gemmatimonadetes bacterium]|nr:type II secretion system protein GspD [Gemmatimonadota bacterium]